MKNNVLSVRELLSWLPHIEKKYINSPDWFLDYKFTREMIRDIYGFHKLSPEQLLEIWRNGPNLEETDFCIKGFKVNLDNRDWIFYCIFYPGVKKFRLFDKEELLDYYTEDDIKYYLEKFYE